jgi:hypothetical protein
MKGNEIMDGLQHKYNIDSQKNQFCDRTSASFEMQFVLHLDFAFLLGRGAHGI